MAREENQQTIVRAERLIRKKLFHNPRASRLSIEQCANVFLWEFKAAYEHITDCFCICPCNFQRACVSICIDSDYKRAAAGIAWVVFHESRIRLRVNLCAFFT